MVGLNPETWPILAAFLALQSAITIPLVLYIRSAHEQRVADLKAQMASMSADCAARVGEAAKDRDVQIATLRTIYQSATDYAQKRGDTLHAEKEALVKQLDANSQQMFRAVDTLAELREAVRDLTRARQAP